MGHGRAPRLHTPNAGATNLRTLRTKKLLVTVPDISNPFSSIESGAVAGERLLGRKNPPKAIFCFNDEVAMGVLEIARRLKLRVPEHVSIVGFDDIRFAAYVDPPLTTIVQAMRQIGEGTVRLLLETLQGGGPPESVTLPHVLVVRSSTGRLQDCKGVRPLTVLPGSRAPDLDPPIVRPGVRRSIRSGLC
jgi:DNA-binding LacI/PurR family transcriptional regulator